jgi:hypothetical protein
MESAAPLPLSPPADPELACPLCGYNLRGLIEPRCPECGFAFQWDELRDLKRQRHRYLFEHGAGKSWGTFWKTVWHTWRPKEFWTDLIPAMPVRPARLITYWLLTAAMAVALLSVPWIAVASNLARINQSMRASFNPIPNRPGWVRSTRHQMPASRLPVFYPLPTDRNFVWAVWDTIVGTRRGGAFLGHRVKGVELEAAVIVLVWPWLLMGTLLIFRASMRQAKIKPVHVLRTVIYSCDFGFTAVLAVAILTFSDVMPIVGFQLMLVLLVCAADSTYRLSYAFSRYLRVHMPVATVVASQTILLLAIATAITNLMEFANIRF